MKGEFENLIEELQREAIQEPQHELGRLEELRLKIGEARKEFPAGAPTVPMKEYVRWFQKWFGVEK